jgi:hypothetical protein
METIYLVFQLRQYNKEFIMRGSREIVSGLNRMKGTGEHAEEYIEYSWQRDEEEEHECGDRGIRKLKGIGDFTSLTNIKVQNMFLESPA